MWRVVYFNLSRCLGWLVGRFNITRFISFVALLWLASLLLFIYSFPFLSFSFPFPFLSFPSLSSPLLSSPLLSFPFLLPLPPSILSTPPIMRHNCFSVRTSVSLVLQKRLRCSIAGSCVRQDPLCLGKPFSVVTAIEIAQ